MRIEDMWNCDADVPDCPEWCEGMTYADAASIYEGGCASGAWMPAVTYYQAREIMGEHGDDVLQYLEDNYGELPAVPAGGSWSGIAVFYLSAAVEAFAGEIVSRWEDADGPEDLDLEGEGEG